LTPLVLSYLPLMNDPRRSFAQSPEPKKKEKKKKKLELGQIVKSKTNAWTVDEILGSGGFGYVYKVHGENKEDVYAMKTEYNDPKGRKSNDRLKVEMSIFTVFNEQTDSEKIQHFLKMNDKGQTDQFKYIVMTIVSHSLDILRRDYLDSMTWTSIFNISLQTLKSIEDLHTCGYLHRDIKPHNFAIGLPPKDSTIFMIDFGIARRYMEKDGKLRVPRMSVRFLGTVRFASRNCHNEREQCRRDDLESWSYMVLDLFNPENITWRRVEDRVKVAMCKHQLFTRSEGCRDLDAPKEMYKILAYINELGYADVPDYGKIREHLEKAAIEEKLDLTRKFDWVGVELKKKVHIKKKGNAANRITDDDEETEPSKKKKKEARRKRFSMENDSSSEDEVKTIPKEQKPPTRRTVSKPGHVAALSMAPSAKSRLKKAAFGSTQGSRESVGISVGKVPSCGSLKSTNLQTVIQRDQTSIVSPCQTISGPAPPNYPKSNYNTAIPRTPAPGGSTLVPVTSIGAPSRRKKGG
ncbi:hypothetical protein PFISCL1PPCAC_20256, partial [Pristionchus fissidentatus]